MIIKNEAIRGFIAKLLSCGSFVNKIIPKRKRAILLYSNTGFKDNLMTLFDYFIRHDYSDKYKIIISLNDYKFYKSKYASRLNGNIKFTSNISGPLSFLTSKYVFYYNGKIPITPAKNQVVVNMWHGIPLKKIGRLLSPKKNIDYSTHYLAPTKDVGDIMCDCFGCDYSKILLCPAPRNDKLFFPSISQSFLHTLNEFEHRICWLPTFRSSDISNTLDSSLSDKSKTGLPIIYEFSMLEELNDFLNKHSCLLIIKLHPAEKNTQILKYNYSNILMLSDKNLSDNDTDLYSVLSTTDGLITDYSSVYFDYLTLDKPICFAIDDMDSYKKNRGFTVSNPLSVMPGDVALNYSDLLHFCENIISDPMKDNDKFADSRLHILKRFCGTSDGHNTRLMLKKLGLTL